MKKNYNYIIEEIFFRKAKKLGLFNRDHRWTFVFEDYKSSEFPVSDLQSRVAFFTMADDGCCDLVASTGKIVSLNELMNVFIDIYSQYLKINILRESSRQCQ